MTLAEEIFTEIKKLNKNDIVLLAVLVLYGSLDKQDTVKLQQDHETNIPVKLLEKIDALPFGRDRSYIERFLFRESLYAFRFKRKIIFPDSD